MTSAGKNRLTSEVSPYLLQHKGNPVHWWSWGPEALAAAKAEGKPILLSIGYAACHWCHVMAHESFEEAETAALMNDLYINIKVDREERPDLDAVYQRALGLMGQQGGWPLTMFLDPAGAPFWGGTYFPNQPRHGRADFRSVLRQVHNLYRSNPAAVEKNRTILLQGLKDIGRIAQVAGGSENSDENITEKDYLDAAEVILTNMDMEHGGTNGAPKFPSVPLLEFLWRVGLRTGNEDYKLAVTKTLTHICQGGIYDHLGGGVCRYSTDTFWLAPHFEKMLYDNALFIDILCEVWKETANPLYEARVRETIGWLFDEMTTNGCVFSSALDADTEGEEGKFYVWDKSEVEGTLGKDADRFMKHYGVQDGGNWEGKTILNRLHDPENFDLGDEKALAPLKKKLLAVRNKRPRPFLDDKVLADWNGLMISALVNAGKTFSQPSWSQAAAKAFDFIAKTMTKGGVLHHSYREGRLGATAFLDDYAAMIRASLALFSVSGDEKYLSKAVIWASEAEKWLSEDDFKGFFISSSKNTDLIARPRSNFDQATPAGNSGMIQNYLSLYRLTGAEGYREKVEKLLFVFAGAAKGMPMACTSYFSAFDSHLYGAHLFIKGAIRAPKTRAFLEIAAGVSFPGLIVHPGTDAPGPLKEPVAALKAGSALLCQGTRCSLPLTNPAMLKEELIRLRQTKI